MKMLLLNQNKLSESNQSEKDGGDVINMKSPELGLLESKEMKV
jgi:hypothetical protein